MLAHRSCRLPPTLLTRPALNARGAMACVRWLLCRCCSTVAKIITAPLVLGLNIFGYVLKLHGVWLPLLHSLGW